MKRILRTGVVRQYLKDGVARGQSEVWWTEFQCSPHLPSAFIALATCQKRLESPGHFMMLQVTLEGGS